MSEAAGEKRRADCLSSQQPVCAGVMIFQQHDMSQFSPVRTARHPCTRILRCTSPSRPADGGGRFLRFLPF
jgi:hypothetical protein